MPKSMAIIFVAALLLGPPAVFAAPLKACATDAANLCPDTKGRTQKDCLREHADELSEACSAALEKRKKGKGKGKGRGACKQDIAKFCEGVERGKGRIHTCLSEHKDELSESCRKAFGARSGK